MSLATEKKQCQSTLTHEKKNLAIDYNRFVKPSWIFTGAALLLVFYYLLGFSFKPEAFGLGPLSVAGLIGKILVDQYLLECLTVTLLFRMLRIYAGVLKLDRLVLSPATIARYLLWFLPLAPIAFFFYNPVTQSLRFLLRHYPELDLHLYLDDYLFSFPLYAAYLGFTLPLIYVALGLNLWHCYQAQPKMGELPARLSTREPANGSGFLKRVVVEHSGRKKLLPTNEVYWFEVVQRKYFAVSKQGSFRIQKKIIELEAELDPHQFLRAHRNLLLNMDHIESFSPWFNGKYIVTMADRKGTEFPLPKRRVAGFKKLLEAYKKTDSLSQV